MKITITVELDEDDDPARVLGFVFAKKNAVPAANAKPEGPWRPLVPLLEQEDEPERLTKICRNCSTEFTTTSKVRTLCDDCFYEPSALRPSEIKRKEIQRSLTSAPRARGPRVDRSAPRFIMEGIKHGVPGGYKKGCRCWPCTDAKQAEMRKYEQAKRDREAARA